MNWIYTHNQTPITYKTGIWDGKNSDQVIAEDENGIRHLAHYCDGFMDGSSFGDWIDSNDYYIKLKVVRWLKIPE